MKNKVINLPLEKIVRDVLHYAPAKIIPGFLGFLAIIVFTRFLSPEEYGLYILSLTAVSITIAICFEWLNKSVLRYFEKYKQNEQFKEFLSTVIDSLVGILMIVLLSWYSGIFLLKKILPADLILLLNVGGLVIFFQTMYTFILCVNQAAQKSYRYAVFSITNAIIKLVVAVTFIWLFHMGSVSILWGIIVAAGSILMWNIFSPYPGLEFRSFSFSKKIFRNLIAYGTPLIGLSVASYILVAADRYMIGYFLGASDVGIYSAGYNLASELMQFPMAILLLASYPIIMETFEGGKNKETSLLLNKLLAIYLIFFTPIVFGMAGLANNITSVVLGENFEASFSVLFSVAAGVFFFGLTQYLYKPFELKEKTMILSLLVFLSAVLNVALNFFFIPKFGILGAAYATLISYLFYFLVTWWIGKKLFYLVFPWQTFAKTLLASGGMYLVVNFLAENQPINLLYLVMEVLTGAIYYFIILFILKEKLFLEGVRSLYLSFIETVKKKQKND